MQCSTDLPALDASKLTNSFNDDAQSSPPYPETHKHEVWQNVLSIEHGDMVDPEESVYSQEPSPEQSSCGVLEGHLIIGAVHVPVEFEHSPYKHISFLMQDEPIDPTDEDSLKHSEFAEPTIPEKPARQPSQVLE
jgi:hypothetical protein